MQGVNKAHYETNKLAILKKKQRKNTCDSAYCCAKLRWTQNGCDHNYLPSSKQSMSIREKVEQINKKYYISLIPKSLESLLESSLELWLINKFNYMLRTL